MTREQFRALADRALEISSADDVSISLSDRGGGTTRFANNQITQNVDTRRQSLAITVAYENRRGSASTTDLSDDGLRDAVERAQQAARVSPPDPEYMPPLPPQTYPVLASLRTETAAAGPARRLADAREAIIQCQGAGMSAAGIVETGVEAAGVANDKGLFAYEQRSEARFSVTATAEDSTGWVSSASRSVDDLGVAERTRVAIEKAQRSARPGELPPGKYTVILEPAAVAGLVNSLLFSLNAKSYYRGTSALAGKLGQAIIDPRFSVQNRPDHPQLMGDGFNAAGLPTDYHTWIDRGILARLNYDRFTAREHGVEPSYSPDAVHMSAADTAGAALSTIDDLLRGVSRAILVTNFWYIRSVNPADLTLTGMTRDGTFLVENGEIVGGVLNFRWHDSPLRVLNAIEAYSRPMDATSQESDKKLLPALRVADFNFTSVTRF